MSFNPPRESELEREVVKYAESRGWFQFKIMRASKKSIPDRFLARDGVVILMELKRDGEEPVPQQLERHKQLREHGVTVYVIDNLEEAKEILR